MIVLDNLSTGFREVAPANATLVVGDTGDAALVSALIAEHGVDAVTHFAASTVVPESGGRRPIGTVVAHALARERKLAANDPHARS